jgi:hypothetical protein
MDAIQEAQAPSQSAQAAGNGKGAAQPPENALSRFERSMIIDYEKWHDGIRYDLDAIEHAYPEERKDIEDLLVESKGCTWRDIEALAKLDTVRSRNAIRDAFDSGDPQVRVAVLNYAPDIVSSRERIDAIIHSLRVSDICGGLSETLDMVKGFHPPEVVEELFRCVQGARARLPSTLRPCRFSFTAWPKRRSIGQGRSSSASTRMMQRNGRKLSTSIAR